MVRDADAASEAATELAALCGSAPSSSPPGRGRPAKQFRDNFTWASGKPVCCDACGAEKGAPDLTFPGESMWWETHNFDDPGRHDSIDRYCLLAWTRQKYKLSKKEFIEWAQTGAGKIELAALKESMVEKRRAGGRITKKSLEAAASAFITRKDENEVRIEEPSDTWEDAADFEERTGYKPEVDGIKCTWLSLSNGSKAWGFWKRGEGPITRTRAQRTSVGITERIDDSNVALSENQLANRFKDEARALQDSALPAVSASSSQDTAAATEVHPASGAAAPLGRWKTGALPAETAEPVAKAKTAKRSANSTPGAKATTPKKAKMEPSASPAGSGGTAGPIPSVRMLEQRADVSSCLDQIMKCKTLDDVTAAEKEALKAIKSLEKKKQRSAQMDKMDSIHLAFQIEVDDAHENIITLSSAMTELKKFQSAAKAKGTTKVSSPEALRFH